MIKNNFWDSIVWIIIWVFIISFIILWVSNLIINSQYIINDYEDRRIINILNNNIQNVIKNFDFSNINEGEIFYIYKNNNFKKFEIFTWALNSKYKNIDEYWNYIDDINNYEWKKYSMFLWVERRDDSLWKTHEKIKININ